MKKKVAVIIPTYVERLSPNEEISLCQCRRVLEKHDRYFVAPEGLSVSYAVQEHIIYVEKDRLTSRKSYSDYVLSLEFYELFQEYEYILIYQLDSFVFFDGLEQFCDKGYDYIGAPWINGLECHAENKQLWYVGNGGFSLRNVDAFIRWLKNERNALEQYKMFLLEDMIIAMYGSSDLRIAPIDVCLKFAFDLNPRECYEKNNKKYPFGCHAWHRFQNSFWKPIIDSFGYDMEELRCVDEEAEILNSGKIRHGIMERCLDKNLIGKCIRAIIEKYTGDIYVFGSGKYGLSFLNIAKDSGVNILGYIDNDASKIGKKICGYSIFSPSILKDEDVVLITLARPEKVEEQLTDMGKEKGKTFATSHDLQMKMIEWKEK